IGATRPAPAANAEAMKRRRCMASSPSRISRRSGYRFAEKDMRQKNSRAYSDSAGTEYAPRDASVARREPQRDPGKGAPRRLIPLQRDDLGGRSAARGLELVGRHHVARREGRQRDPDQQLQPQRHGVLLGTNCRPAWAIIDLASAMVLASAFALA